MGFLSSPSVRRTLSALVLALAAVACEKKAPPDPHVLRGYAALREDPSAALAEFEAAREPDRIDALLGRGLALEGLRRYPEARALLERAAASGEPDSVLALARVETMLGATDRARALVARLVEKSPTERSVLLLEACLASDGASAERSLGHLDAWLATLKKNQDAPELAPAEIHLARAQLLRQLGSRDAANAELSSARKRWLSSPDEALSFAVLATTAGKLDLARLLVERLLESELPDTLRLRGAELAFRLGDLRSTGPALRALTESSPDRLRLQARYDFATQSPQAPDSLGRALAATQNPPERVEFALALAETHLRAGRFDEARKATDALLGEHPEASGARLVLARIELAAGQADAALERLAPLLAGTPPSGARELAALAHLAAKRPAAARPFLLALLDEDPTHRRAAQLLVAVERDAGRIRELHDAIADLIRRAPRDLTLRLLWLDLLRKTAPARVPEAVTAGLEALPEEPRLWLEAFRSYEELGKLDEARTFLERGLAKVPEEPRLAAALAASLTKSGRAAEAAPLYALVLRHAEKDVVALNNLASFYVDELRDPGKGLELAERAHALAPREPAVADTLGWALYRVGGPENLRRAESLLESARGALTSPTFEFHLGATQLALGKEDEGRKLLRRALARPERFPEAEEAARLLERDP